MLKRSVLLPVGLCLSMLFIVGCDKGSSVDEGDDTPPLPEQKLAGVWLGYLNTTVYFGIVSEENEVILVGHDSQFAGPEGALSIYPDTFIVQGSLTELALSYSTMDFVVSGEPRSWDFVGTLFGTLLMGSLRTPDEDNTAVELIYNTTYEVEPKIDNIVGTWEFANSMGISGNPISLLITKISSENNTLGTVRMKRGSDAPMLSGTINIHYSNGVPYNIYDVSLRTLDGIDLSGLAAYVEEVSTEGIDVPKTMAIGAYGIDDLGTYRSFSGLASFHSTQTD